MNVKLAVAGSVVAGLLAVGGVAVASTFQSTPAAPAAVVQPAVVETVAPVVAPTTAAPVVKAPAPVQSTQAPVVVAPRKAVAVPKVVAPAPAPVPADVQNNPNLPHDANGNVVLPPVVPGNGQQSDTNGNPIPTPSP